MTFVFVAALAKLPLLGLLGRQMDRRTIHLWLRTTPADTPFSNELCGDVTMFVEL